MDNLKKEINKLQKSEIRLQEALIINRSRQKEINELEWLEERGFKKGDFITFVELSGSGPIIRKGQLVGFEYLGNGVKCPCYKRLLTNTGGLGCLRSIDKSHEILSIKKAS